MKNLKKLAAVLFSGVLILCAAVTTMGGQRDFSEKIQQNANRTVSMLDDAGINVTAAQIKSGGFKAIQEALTKAAQNGTDARPCVVTIEPGTYTLTNRIYIGSNTKLVLKGVTLSRNSTANIIKIGMPDNYMQVKGYYYKNIAIEGGTLDGKNFAGTVVSAGHVENFSMNNVTVKNTKNTHLMETGGVNGLSIQNCNFLNQTLSSKAVNTYEAIQLDILCKDHFATYRSENLTTKNVEIDHCTFRNVPRGVGSHTGILNNPMDGIKITNCTFAHLKSAAVQGQNWINCTISNNKISDAPRGIAIYSMKDDGQGTYKPSVLASQGKIPTSVSDKYQTPQKNQKIVVQSNVITLNKAKDPYADYVRVGILISGGEVTKVKKYSDASGSLPTGNYYASGAVVSGNTITTAGHGIRLSNARNSRVENNKISFGSPADQTSYYGIQATLKSTGNVINGNTVTKANTNAIYLNYKSSAKEISNNTITSPKKYGIDLEQSKATTISGNVIKSAAINGIYVYKNSSAASIENNKISSSKRYGINLEKSKATTISGNVIKSAGVNGIYVYKNSSSTFIKNNKISSSKKYGIDIEKSTAKTISGNEVSKSGTAGIYLYNKGKSTNIKNNTINTAGKYGIGVNTKSSASNITGNKVSATKDIGIAIGNSTVSNISENTVSNTGSSGIKVYNGSTAKYVKNNTVKSPKEYGIYFSSKAKGTEISYNYVSGGKKERIWVTKDSKVKKVTGNNILTAPRLVKVSNVKGGIKISWKKVSNAQSYIVYRKSGSSQWKKIKEIKNIKTSSYTDKLKSSYKGKKFTYTVAVKQKGSKNQGYNTKGLSIVYKPSAKK